MPDRLKGRGLTKSDPLALQVGGLAQGQQPCPVKKKHYVTKTRQEQAGFRRGRGCADQLSTLRNIIEQCTEWQRQLYINFVDFQKAFDSIHRDSLWHILRAYGIPQKIVQLIQSFYEAFTCSFESSGIRFEVKTGVRQGCVMSALLFNLAIDWVMRRTTEDHPRGIRI